MNKIELQGKSIEALKSFNNTIVTSRLYPPEAPQVATAIDRGYKGIKMYLRQYGSLRFSLIDELPYLAGQVLEQEVLDLFPNLVVYRQLRLLEVENLIVRSEMDRFAFGQLLIVFNASAVKIKNEGGGLEYITSLGLASYFPDGNENFDDGLEKDEPSSKVQSKNLLAVRPELVACLLGRDKRPVVESELRQKMSEVESAVDVLAACVAHILLDIQKEKKIVASEKFPLMLEKTEKRIDPDKKAEIAQRLAKILVGHLREPALCVIMAQEYPTGFGHMVYAELTECLPEEKIAKIIILFREHLAKVVKISGVKSVQAQFLGKAFKLLMDSKKGKHFLSTEKVKNLIHDGERERKKRRIKAGIDGLLQGKTRLLKSNELVDYLPTAVQSMLKNPKEGDVTAIINGMVNYFSQGSGENVEPLLKSMAAIAENLMIEGQWGFMDLLQSPMMDAVRRGSVQEPLLEDIVTLLQKVMQKSWLDGENDRGDGILSLFHQVRSGQIPLHSTKRNIVAKVQDRGIRRSTLPQFLEQCLAAPKNEALSYRLILQGPVVLRFLVESLINTNEASHRLKIIDLLTYSPHFLPTVVHERLQEHMPWYGKRNLIKLLGETGSEEDAESILPYLRHEDFRVQREAFLTLFKIGGKNRKQLLLKALEYSSESIKIQIVMALANLCDAEVAIKLVELLGAHEYFSDSKKQDLLLQLLETLGRCPCSVAHKGIAAFLETRGQRQAKKIPDTIWAVAEKALKFLHKELQETRRKHVQASQLRKNALKQAAKIKRTGVTQRVITGLPQEQLVRTLLASGDKNTAMDQLLELIERTARQRNFVHAEKLKEWLVEIDPFALGKIVQASEMIGREKIESTDKSHVEIWSDLYDILTTEEFSAVYNALKHKNYENGEIVVNQGAVQSTLYFVNSGKAKLFYEDSKNDFVINIVNPGQIFGGAGFFEASVWTMSVAAVGPTELSFLKHDIIERWAEEFPRLEKKLQEFCKKFEKIENVDTRLVSDRRKHKRYRVEGKVSTILLDSLGRDIGTNFIVDLFDISEGGLSCLLRIPSRENGRLMLGKKMQFLLPKDTILNEGIVLAGDILAVKRTLSAVNEYSLHLQFDNQIDRKQLHDILMIMREKTKVFK